MGTTTTMQAYGEAWYWDKRYSTTGGGGNSGASFDWYQKYSSLAPLLRLYLPPPSPSTPILVVGCGNSAFSEGLADDGYKDVVNIDISSVVIDAMQHKYSNRPQLSYIRMDARDMSAFGAATFNAVADKGTLDSILCGSDSRLNAAKMLHQVWRVLKDKGVYILITYGAPVCRLQLLRESCFWRINLHVIGKALSEDGSKNPVWELTNPVPLKRNGSSVEAVLGKNLDVHYIYVCIKDESMKPDPKHEAADE